MGDMFRQDPRSTVKDIEKGAVKIAADATAQLHSGEDGIIGAVAQGVITQVDQDLAQVVAVETDLYIRRLNIDRNAAWLDTLAE